jgi:hypothetical protein
MSSMKYNLVIDDWNELALSIGENHKHFRFLEMDFILPIEG